MPTRYIVAVAVSCLVTAAGLGISRHFHRSFVEHVRQSVRAAAAAGTLPKELEGVDLDNFKLENMEVRVDVGWSRRLMIADFLVGFWFVWIPVTFTVSIAIAYLSGGRAGP